jgi:hypothetical protein
MPKKPAASEKEQVSVRKDVANQFRSYVDAENINRRIRGEPVVTYTEAMSVALLAALPVAVLSVDGGESDVDITT